MSIFCNCNFQSYQNCKEKCTLNFVYIAIKLYLCEIWVPIALTSLNIDMSEKFENINGKKKDNHLHSTTQKSKDLDTGTNQLV